MRSKALKIFSVTALSLLLATGCGCQKKKEQDNKQENQNNQPAIIDNQILTQSGVVDGFQCELTGAVYDGSMTTMTFKVTNVTEQAQSLNEIDASVVYMDGDIERKATLTFTIVETLEPGQSEVVSSSIDTNLSQTKSVQYTILK